MSNKRAIVSLTPELLIELLKLPKTTSFIDIRINHFKGSVLELLLEDRELFDEVPEGAFYPDVQAIYLTNGKEVTEFVKYEKDKGKRIAHGIKEDI